MECLKLYGDILLTPRIFPTFSPDYKSSDFKTFLFWEKNCNKYYTTIQVTLSKINLGFR